MTLDKDIEAVRTAVRTAVRQQPGCPDADCPACRANRERSEAAERVIALSQCAPDLETVTLARGLIDGYNAQARRVAAAVEMIERFGGIDGEHHKTWVIDRVARALLGEQYAAWVVSMRAGEDGPNTYTWDEGIAP